LGLALNSHFELSDSLERPFWSINDFYLDDELEQVRFVFGIESDRNVGQNFNQADGDRNNEQAHADDASLRVGLLSARNALRPALSAN
jgi:hypothetical protein